MTDTQPAKTIWYLKKEEKLINKRLALLNDALNNPNKLDLHQIVRTIEEQESLERKESKTEPIFEHFEFNRILRLQNQIRLIKQGKVSEVKKETENELKRIYGIIEKEKGGLHQSGIIRKLVAFAGAATALFLFLRIIITKGIA